MDTCLPNINWTAWYRTHWKWNITRDDVAKQQHTHKQDCLTLTDNISLLSIDNTSYASWFWGPRRGVHYAAPCEAVAHLHHLNQVNKLTQKN